MATQRPISTISYNTESFLVEKLDTWVENHLIQSYQYIKHQGEDGAKDHIHLRVEPNKRLDPMDLTEDLKEWIQGQDKPLGVRPWRNSREEDWFLYAVHDSQYLKIKYGESQDGEKLPYKWQDIKASQDYDIEDAFVRAQQSMKHSNASLISRLEQGQTPMSLIKEGENPFLVRQLSQALVSDDYQRLYEDHQELHSRFSALLSALNLMGLSVSWDNKGTCSIHQEEYEEAFDL